MASKYFILKILVLAKMAKNGGASNDIFGIIPTVGMGGIGNFTCIVIQFTQKVFIRQRYKYRTDELLEHVYMIVRVLRSEEVVNNNLKYRR